MPATRALTSARRSNAMSTDSPAPAAPVLFNAVLYPNRSLGRQGFRLLMAAIVVVSLVVGGVFLAMGAWPVAGLFGLDILLIYLAFKWNYRSARLVEFVRLDKDGLHIRRVHPNGSTEEWRLSPYWVRVEMADPPRHDSQLKLGVHGDTITLGAFLTADERVALAHAIQSALSDYRRQL
ncbi:DUF2244 domain-containing protein [Marinivivus vitaminiproducens]|uniref:DUF2244 domain-containing protein n=1 Tax=Marinivivus vitaminiproducens TaxID=3035935 RepID=UPI0027AA2004|nr:DUF2244 domain-containing protein [Geminicoccaceae bacterium SCSIO 64248]